MDDAAFKKIFFDPRMMRFLIRRHVPEWADRVDYRTLQPLPTELIDEQLRRRYPDMTWRVRTRNGSTDLILLVEFQSPPERRMALRTTIYGCLAAQSLLQHDKELAHGDRELAVVALVLHHGDRRWNAATRLSDLFRDSAPDVYRAIGRMPPNAQPTGPEDLPQVVLGLSGVTKAEQMRAALTVLLPLVEVCEDEDFDRFMARSVKAMLLSKGFSSQQLEEAMTMSTVVTEFQRSWDEVRQEGVEQGIEQGQVAVLVQLIARKFGQGTAEGVLRLIEGRPGRDRIAKVADAILDCDTPEEFVGRVREG
ncbi:MAG: Rpn family recombination-promoting nuclease/putative transposase [Gemmatimonadota bacterium]|nr:Rpn family recombination-promoting nuclease/putative transposase [Gemmatimonadota bacterium]MDE2985898.1 Rpn family recombination-promoting nuclease/putative transposase [Gemmatimonadota bacterium]